MLVIDTGICSNILNALGIESFTYIKNFNYNIPNCDGINTNK